ncbi:metallophosphoesterase [Salininema proteolyticum]|uniref:Metallophosphoesterase n=1 Tax=Salininema proteolyticum TaxID=1607685 RepID=A0ABV8U112_9ACTN
MFGVLALLLGGAHYYLWHRLVKATTAEGSRARRAGAVVLAVMCAFSLAALAAVRNVPVSFQVKGIVSWIGYTWLVLLMFAGMVLVAAEPVRWILNRRIARAEREPVAAGGGGSSEEEAAGEEPRSDSSSVATATEAPPTGPPEEGGPTGLTRRRTVAAGIAATAATVSLVTTGYGLYEGMRPPRYKPLEVPLARLPRKADGFRVALLSDIHLSPMVGRSRSRVIVDAVNRVDADLVAVVGDLVDGTVSELGDAVAPLADLDSRYGTFFVTGNHEYYSGVERWIEEIQEIGMRPLENVHAELPHFDLAGVDDVQAEEFPNEQSSGPDFAAALGDRDPDRAAVLLAHQPVVIDQAVDWGVDLQLSGHTHGGQIWPGTLLAGLPNPTVAGLESYGDTQLYVSRGAGAWGPQVRVGAPSEISVVTLRSLRA